MLVHSFSKTHRWFDDFAAFSRALQMPLYQPGQCSVARILGGVSLRLAWGERRIAEQPERDGMMSTERTSRYIYGTKRMLFLRSFRMLSVQVDALALTQMDVAMCTGKCALREQTVAPCAVCLWICRVRLEC